jgi:metal-responsive CopG/Arc/MetJ family transcriptional regulator
VTSESRAARQRAHVKSIRLHNDILDRAQRFADANQMSRSEAVREAIDHYLKKGYSGERKREQSKVSIWIEPKDYVEFTRQVTADGVTIGAAIEAALEEIM